MTAATASEPEVVPAESGDDVLYEIVGDDRVELPPMAVQDARTAMILGTRMEAVATELGAGRAVIE